MAASEAYLTLTATEAAFLSAAYDTFIPADRLSPSGTDCGLGTRVHAEIAWAKLQALVEGAALASKQLWPRG